jgi:hypothetical protein
MMVYGGGGGQWKEGDEGVRKRRNEKKNYFRTKTLI